MHLNCEGWEWDEKIRREDWSKGDDEIQRGGTRRRETKIENDEKPLFMETYKTVRRAGNPF